MHTQIKTYFDLHLLELKYNFILFFITFLYNFLICLYFSNQLIFLLVKNLIKLNMLKYFIFTNITEIFLTNINISLFITCFITLNLLIFQIWYFISPGLFQNENYKIIKYYIIYNFFNIFIIFFILIKMIPSIWYFFINTEISNQYLFNVYFEPNFNNYFHFIYISFIYIYIICLYIFLFCLLFKQFFNIQTIINLRKFFYLKFILISMLITPPDFINQIIIFLNFLFFFEIFIFINLYLYKYFFNKI